MTPLWFWGLTQLDMGVWAPIYSGFPDYAHGRFTWPQNQKPLFWVRII